MEKQKINVWAFSYNHMTWESSSQIISYHRTKKGAETAMSKHKNKLLRQFNRMYGNDTPFEFGEFEWWGVHKFKIVIEE